MPFVDDLDRWAAELRDAPDMTYEIAVYVATRADGYTAATPSEAAAVEQLRDVFGTWVERIHSSTSAVGEAEASPRDITAALREWSASRDRDLARYAARWGAEVGRVDTSWMNHAAPLARRSPRRFWGRRRNS